jgi:hypothetical protein
LVSEPSVQRSITDNINFDAGADGARVGVVSYGNSAVQGFSIGDYPNTAAGLAAMQTAISALPHLR